jgi:hypothetical protein
MLNSSRTGQSCGSLVDKPHSAKFKLKDRTVPFATSFEANELCYTHQVRFEKMVANFTAVELTLIMALLALVSVIPFTRLFIESELYQHSVRTAY